MYTNGNISIYFNKHLYLTSSIKAKVFIACSSLSLWILVALYGMTNAFLASPRRAPEARSAPPPPSSSTLGRGEIFFQTSGGYVPPPGFGNGSPSEPRKRVGGWVGCYPRAPKGVHGVYPRSLRMVCPSANLVLACTYFASRERVQRGDLPFTHTHT